MLQPTNRLTLIDAMRPPPGLRSRVGDGRDVHARSAGVAGGTGRLRTHWRRRASPATEASTSRSSCSTPCGPMPASSPSSARWARSPSRHRGECSHSSSRRWSPFEHPAAVSSIPRSGCCATRRPRRRRRRGAARRRLRVLIASRNLTFDASWDTVVRLDESPDGSGARPRIPRRSVRRPDVQRRHRHLRRPRDASSRCRRPCAPRASLSLQASMSSASTSWVSQPHRRRCRRRSTGR